jgi:hypothetical protein
MRAVLAALLVVGLTACGERSQEPAAAGERGYQGKRDTLPWDNAPLTAEYRGGKWNKGDRASWEDSIKERQLAQHEHRRIYQ